MNRQSTINRRLPAMLASTLLLGSLTATASAALLIDTGPAAPGASYWTLQSDVTGGSPGSGQWLAASFDLNNDYFITDIAGWMVTDGQTGNTFTISVYADGGAGVPDTGNLLYSNQATVTGTGPANWEGYHIGFGNGLELNAGTYWLGFEVRPGNTYAGGMPAPSVSPLLNEAFNGSGTWLDFDDLDIGVRISGDLTQVPLPAAAPLFASVIGLMGFAARRRKRQSLI